MTNFSDFNIKPSITKFTGDKIKMYEILDKSISILDFKIDDSKCYQQKGNGKCLTLQFTFENKMRIIFTSGSTLMDQIQQVPKPSGFPFNTTIIKVEKVLKFT